MTVTLSTMEVSSPDSNVFFQGISIVHVLHLAVLELEAENSSFTSAMGIKPWSYVNDSLLLCKFESIFAWKMKAF